MISTALGGVRKETTDARLQIDIREFVRGSGGEIGGRVFIRWNSQHTEDPVATLLTLSAVSTLSVKHVGGSLPDEIIDLTYSPCHLGGRRAWFLCSRIGCGRKMAVLYDTPIGFRCRYCAKLVYQSTRERPYDRMLRRARRIRAKAGGDANLVLPFPNRPRGMHQKTFEKLTATEAQLWGDIGQQAGKRYPKQTAGM